VAGLDGIVGQQRVVARLVRSLRVGRLPHALLFSGPPGVGKAEMALGLAQVLVCLQGDGAACGVCGGCRKVATGQHPDVLRLEPPAGKLKILIDQVRALQHGLAYRPFEGRHRVIIVPEADRLTEEAANALLKTLEEPPDFTHFVLTSPRVWALLPTIRSRCQEVRFAPLGRAAVVSKLLGEGREAAGLELAAGLAEGSLGRAREILEQGVVQERIEVLSAVYELRLSDPVPLLELSERWYRERERVGDRLTLLLSWYRDVLVLASGGGEQRLLHGDLELAPARDLAKVLGRGGSVRCMERIRAAKTAIEERNANVRLALERLFLGLAQEAERGREGSGKRA